MSDKEGEAKSKRLIDSLESREQKSEDEEKRSTRKKPRIDYSEEKKASSSKDAAPVDPQAGTSATATTGEPSKSGKAEEEDDDIQEVTPAEVKTKPEAGSSNESPSKGTEDKPDDLLGLPVEQVNIKLIRHSMGSLLF